MGFARRVWLIGTALTAAAAAVTAAAAVVAAWFVLGSSQELAPAFRLVCGVIGAAVALVVAAASVVWEFAARRITARVEPLARTLQGAAVKVGEAARDAAGAGRLLEEHAARHRGLYEPLAGLAVACARDTLATSRTLTTQACVLEFVGSELGELLDTGCAASSNVIAFEPQVMTSLSSSTRPGPALRVRR